MKNTYLKIWGFLAPIQKRGTSICKTKITIPLLSLFLVAPMALTFGQVENPEVNYRIQTASGSFLRDGDGGCIGGNNPGCHDEEVVFKAAVCQDVNNSATTIATPANSPDPNTPNCGTGIKCNNWVLDCYRNRCNDILWRQELAYVTNAPHGRYDIDWRAYDDDDSLNDCSGGTVSDYSQFSRMYDVTSSQSYRSTREATANTFSGKWWEYWRYSAGTRATPLRFGVITNSTKTHQNSNESIVNDDNLEYSNDWSYRPGDDVTYTFEIEDEAKNVTISLSIASGDRVYTPGLYLSESTRQIDFDYGKNISMSNLLCPGTYTIVIEKYITPNYSDTRDFFTLSVGANAITIDGGMISATNTDACSGFPIPEINSVSTASSIDGNPPSYQWQEFLNGTWQNMINQTGQDLTEPGTMGSGQKKFRREASNCGIVDWSNEVTINPYNGADIDAGSIALTTSNDTIPIGTDPGSINEVSQGTGNPTPITYRWEKCESIDCSLQSNWGEAGGNITGSSYDIPELHKTTSFRRVAINGCDAEANSDVIEITVVEPNGIIEGKVTSPVVVGGGSAVRDVEIEIKRITSVPGDTLTTDTYYGITNGEGEYSVSDIYYGGDEADFTVTPSKDDGIIHEFTPEYKTVKLRSSLNAKQNVDFIDETTFIVSGNIYQDFSGTLCGMDTVIVNLIGTATSDTTDSDGFYSLPVPGAGTYTIQPVFKNHTFSPPMFQDIIIDSHMENMDFENTETQTLSGFIGGSCSAYLGQSQLTFTSEDLCIVYHTDQNDFDGNGNFNVSMPARPYRVQVTDFPNPNPYTELEVEAFFQNTIPIDLTEKDTMQDFIYRPKPTIEVTGFPADVCNRTVLEQLVGFDLTINVWEGPTSCPVDTGYLLISDEISDSNNFVLNIPISNGEATYSVLPGFPNLTAPYLKNLTIVARDTFDQSVTYTKDALVTGVRPRNSTFTTVTPEIPMLIVHDPPGDNSYAYVERGQTTAVKTGFMHKEGGSVNVWKKVKLGAEFLTGIGFAVRTKTYGKIGTSYEAGISHTTNNETVTTLTTTERFSTAGNQSVIGAKGDVFIGGAMNLIYANTDVIEFDPNTCTVTTDVDLMFAPSGFATTYIYTDQHIRNTIIKDLIDLANNSQEPDKSFYLDQVSVWEQALLRNEELKEDATFVENISISSLAEHSGSVTSSTTNSHSWQYNIEINAEAAAEANAEAGGNGIEGGVKVKFMSDFGPLGSTDTTNTFTTGYFIKDDDAGDTYTIDIKTDKFYKTPVFDVRAAKTSCPYEPGTLQRDVPMLSVEQAIVTNVDPSTSAIFELKLRNESENSETRDYVLKFNQQSNPDGATIKVSGSEYDGTTQEYTIGYLQEETVTVEVEKGPIAYSYENLEFVLLQGCGDLFVDDFSVADTVVLSAYFDSPCSDISLFEPISGWVMNASSQVMDVHIKDYLKSLMNSQDQIKIQYAQTGSTDWLNAAVLTKADLNFNIPGGSNLGDITTINLANVEDGSYNIRLALVCGAGTVYSSRASGLIDRTPPELFGIPTPLDDIYIEGQTEIRATFDQAISCSQVQIDLLNVTTDMTFTATKSCIMGGNDMIIVPEANLPNGIYQITVKNLEDIHGNTSDDVSWNFNVGEIIDEDCGPLVIDNNDLQLQRIKSDVYRGTTILSFGDVSNLSEVEMIGEISVSLDPGFEVEQNSTYLADIGDCDDAPDQNAPCHTAQPVTRGNIYNSDTNFGSIQGTGITCGPGDDDNYSNWYTLTGTNEVVTAYLCESAGWDVVIEVYTGTCGQELTCVTDNSTSNTVAGCTVPAGEAIFMAQQDVTYYIRVRGEQAADQGRYALFIDACSTDLFSLKYYYCDQRLYVDYTATGANDGSSWENAFIHLQDAIAAHTSGAEIWVAKGTYYPDQGAGIMEGDSTVSFSDLSGSVEIYGGFNGTELPGFEKDNRDIANNVTILSGDIGIKGNMSDNSFTVVHDCFINGVTVTKGNARGPAGSPTAHGGGYHLTKTQIIRECTFIDNHAKIGGGVYSEPSFLNDIWNCSFISNTAEKGGGAYIADGSILNLINCSFSGNVATDTDPNGYDNGSALGISSSIFAPQIVSSIFWGNGTVEDDDIKPQIYTEDCIIELANDAIPLGANNLNEDPLFVDQPDLEDPSANLRLQAGSPAIDKLVGQTPFRTDIDFIPRPQGIWHDIGAYEYVFSNNN